MRTLLFVVAFGIAVVAPAQELAVIGAPADVLATLNRVEGVQVRVVKARPKNSKDAVRAAGDATHVLWIRAQGRRSEALLFEVSGKPLGLIKTTPKKKRWPASALGELALLIRKHVAPAVPPASSSSSGGTVTASAKVEPAVELAVSKASASEGGDGGSPQERAALKPAPMLEPELRPVPAARATTLAAAEPEPSTGARTEFAAFELGLGTDVVWRSYEFCPGALRCGRQVFAGPAGLRFVTDRPYVGGAVTLTGFPLRDLDERLAGVGFEARYARRFLEVGLATELGAVDYVPSYDEEFWGELLYRRGFEVLGLTPWHGVRIGGGTRRFVTGQGAASTSSVRHLGATVGVDAGLPLFGRALQLDAALTYAFGVSPGLEEREAHGGAIVGSDTLRARAGISGRVGRSGLGYALMVDYSVFADSFLGAGTRAEGGAAREEFVTLSASIRYAF